MDSWIFFDVRRGWKQAYGLGIQVLMRLYGDHRSTRAPETLSTKGYKTEKAKLHYRDITERKGTER